MHVTLHPADAKLVIEKGWAQRHPLARGGWLSRFVPEGFMMVYAPRNEEEVEVVMRIVRAAAWWVGGKSCVDEMGRPKMERVETEKEEKGEKNGTAKQELSTEAKKDETTGDQRPAALMKTATEHLRAGD